MLEVECHMYTSLLFAFDLGWLNCPPVSSNYDDPLEVECHVYTSLFFAFDLRWLNCPPVSLVLLLLFLACSRFSCCPPRDERMFSLLGRA